MFHSAYYTAGGAVRQVTYQCDVQIIVQEGFPLPPMSPLGGGVSRRAAAAPLPASSTVRSRETNARHSEPQAKLFRPVLLRILAQV